MVKIKPLFVVAFLLMASVGWTQDTVRMTLDSCLRYAYRHNLSLRSARLDREAAATALQGAKMNFLPSVNASASQGWNWGDGSSHSGSYGVSGSLTIFDGLNNLRSYQQAKVSAEQREQMVLQSQNNISSQIVSAYLTILMDEERLSYQREVLETSRQQQVEGAVKNEVGRILESDYQLLEANLLSAQAEIENTRISIVDSYRTLHDLLCMEPRQQLAVVSARGELSPNDVVLDSYDSVAAQSRRAMPDWEINRMEVEVARYGVEMARSSFLPSLSLNAGVGYNDGSTTLNGVTTNLKGGMNTSLTLGLTVPIFDRGATLTQYRKSKINLQQAELNYEQDSITLTATVKNQYAETQRALNSFRKSEALAEAYHSSYDIYVLKYAEGAVTTVEMLQQQDKYLSALNDYLQSKYSFLLSQRLLDIMMGKEIVF